MRYGYVKTAAVSPGIKVADCRYNSETIIAEAQKADSMGVRLLVFPELSICGCTCGDLFLQDTLLDSCEDALSEIAEKTADMDMLIVVGLPVRKSDALYNCAAVLHKGDLLGIVPKTYVSGGGGTFGLRYFEPAPTGNDFAELRDWKDIPFGTDILFTMAGMPGFRLAVEIGEDMFAPATPSLSHTGAGATIIANPSASSETAGKAERRVAAVKALSSRLICGYICANAGRGESTTDAVFAGHDFIAENGAVIAEDKPFGKGSAVSEIDVSAIAYARRRSSIYAACDDIDYDIIEFDMEEKDAALTRSYPSLPFIEECGSEWQLILEIQAEGLAKRLEHTHSEKAVLGISGGLDSSLAILVCKRAMELLGRPSSDILAVSMPCFGTTERTKSNAQIISEECGADFRCVDITETVEAHFRAIGHDKNDTSVVFENAQARARTYTLMDIANKENGLVVGTGDLSELTLGWATYNGDHMSMYGVNGSVPKTLIRHMLRAYADCTENKTLSGVLTDILDTPVSPELLPSKEGKIIQKTEDIVGPYELHDFILYYTAGKGFSPEKVYMLMKRSFKDSYDNETILKWLKNFYKRFFSQQFKRSCMPDGPKAGPISLSPRGGLVMPSDAVSALWIQQVESLS